MDLETPFNNPNQLVCGGRQTDSKNLKEEQRASNKDILEKEEQGGDLPR